MKTIEDFLAFLKHKDCKPFKCCECIFADKCVGVSVDECVSITNVGRVAWFRKTLWNEPLATLARSCEYCTYQTECDDSIYLSINERVELIKDKLIGVKKCI